MRLKDSPTYGKFCEKVYGRDLRQFNAVDEEQLQKLISSLRLNSSHSILDVGCGLGFISEHLSDLTGAQVTGIDFAGEIIKSARLRTLQKKDRLKFIEMDFNFLSAELGPFDFIISIDTLYFATDIKKTLENLKTLLKPQGQLAFFYSFKCKDETAKPNPLTATNVLTKSLSELNFRTQCFDFSAGYKNIWERVLYHANELKQDFENEGHTETYEGRIWEAENSLKSIKEGHSFRCLYLATLA